MVPRFFPGVERLWHEVNRSVPSITEVQIEWNYGLDRGTFTFAAKSCEYGWACAFLPCKYCSLHVVIMVPFQMLTCKDNLNILHTLNCTYRP